MGLLDLLFREIAHGAPLLSIVDQFLLRHEAFGDLVERFEDGAVTLFQISRSQQLLADTANGGLSFAVLEPGVVLEIVPA